ncbi:MAG: hypothetical protein WCP95_12070 [Actinomycetes bacterium]
MSFSDFITQVPPGVRLLLALAITIGVSLACVKFFHNRMIHFDDKNREAADKARAEAEAREEAEEPPISPRYEGPPETFYLAQRVLGLTATGFVFLLAFTLANFWGNANAARTATVDEASMFARAVALSASIPADQGGDQLRAGLKQYGRDVQVVQWPFLMRADSDAANNAQVLASSAVGKATLEAGRAGASKLPEWGLLTDSLKDMTADATTRVTQLPGPFVPAIIWVIAMLGLVNLSLSAAFQPSRIGPNLFLIGIMAGITGLLIFLVVETSNPFVGGGAVTIPSLG